jgi:hypothetical protein
MSTGGGGDAQEAARINEELSNRAQAIGVPALRGGINYATASLKEPLPGYAQAAYRQAGTSALEAGAARAQTARETLQAGLRRAGGGGVNLTGYGKVAAGAGEDLAQEVGSIGASRATAAIGQRNNLLRILSGGGATALDLSAGFGGQSNQALGILGPNPGAYPYIVGGLSGLTGLFEKYLEKNPLGGGTSSALNSIG